MTARKVASMACGLLLFLLAGNGLALDNSWVDPCEACSTRGNWYKGGCSGLTQRLLGKSTYKTVSQWFYLCPT
jgi:hypothetical protein